MHTLSCTRKLIILITDGVPNDIDAAKQAITSLHQMGIEVIGIAIQSELLRHILPIQANVNSLSELTGAMFGILHSNLLQTRKA